MNRYTLAFNARTIGALGIWSDYQRTVDAPTEDAARLRLYETHEHISGVRVVKVEPLTDA